MSALFIVLAIGSLTVNDLILAHASGLRPGDPWWLAWQFDPLVVFNLCLLTFAYILGVRNIWRRAGRGRGITYHRSIAFLVGILALAIALLSPLDVLSNDLSWVHMLQHMMLMVISAPLVMLGSPGLAVMWALPRSWRKYAARLFWRFDDGFPQNLSTLAWNPILVWTLHALVLWIWHLPQLYQWALTNALVHDIEHLSFFLIACLFWRLVVDARLSRALDPGLAVLYLFTTSIHSMFLGVFMALSPTAWYPIYAGRTDRWGLGILEDQQIAGAIMWMPGCAAYAAAAVILFTQWLHRLERRNQAMAHAV